MGGRAGFLRGMRTIERQRKGEVASLPPPATHASPIVVRPECSIIPA